MNIFEEAIQTNKCRVHEFDLSRFLEHIPFCCRSNLIIFIFKTQVLMSKIQGRPPGTVAGERDASEEWPPGRSSFQLLSP